jgi:hypothetical protein
MLRILLLARVVTRTGTSTSLEGYSHSGALARLHAVTLVAIAGSSQTYAEFAAYRERLFFVPENGISRSLLAGARCNSGREEKLELIFIGGVVRTRLAISRCGRPFLLCKGIKPA